MSTVVEVPRKRHRRRNALIVLVVVILVLVAAFFVGDYFAKKYATNYVRDQIASSLGLPSTAPVTVDLGSGSILFQAVTGRINDVNVTVDPIVLDGLAGSATLTAHGVPLNQTTPVTSLDVKVYVPTSTVSTAIARVPALTSLKPKVTISGKHVAVAGTIYVFGFPQSVGATLTPKVTSGVPGFTIDTATLDGATVTATLLNRYLPGLTTLLESGTSLCIADQLPKSFTLTSISLQGHSIVSTFTGNGVELDGAAPRTEGHVLVTSTPGAANPLAPAWLAVPADANVLEPTVWSANASRTTGGVLEIAGLDVATLVAEYGTPVYVVDETDARGRAMRVRESFDREFARVGSSAHVYYAGKAFLTTEVARWMIAAGLNIDVCSGGELAVALAAGVDPARLGLHGNNKSVVEIDRAVSVGIGAIVLDSLIEIERVAAAAAKHGRVPPVRLRINSGVHASTHEYLATAREDQKFGIPLADAEATVAVIRSHPELSFLGLHSHIGSQIFESDGFAEAARRLFTVHAKLLGNGPVPELNLGGGFGIAYTSVDVALSLDEIARRFADIVSAPAAEFGVPVPIVSIEPGRAIIGPSTATIYEVGTVKDVLVAVDDATAIRKYVSVDGGMSDNIRPALYGADYTVRIASRTSDAPAALVRIAGKHCESGDIVVRADYLPGDVRPGDLVAVPATGAYCWSLANNYNYLGRPPVVAVKDGKARLLVRRETETDLLSRDAGMETT